MHADNTKRLINLSRFVCITCCIITISIAFSVLVGWYANIPFLVEHIEHRRPMSVTAAILFILLAINVVLMILQTKHTTKLSAVILTILSVLVIYMLLGKEFVMPDFLTPKHELYSAFSISANSVTCFIVILLAVMLLECHKFSNARIAWAGGFAAIALSLALIYIESNYTTVLYSHIFDPLVAPAISTAFSFAFIAIALIAAVLHKSLIHQVDVLRFVPPIIGVAIFLITVYLSAAVIQQQILFKDYNILPMSILVIGTLLAILVSVAISYAYFSYTTLQDLRSILAQKSATFDAVLEGLLVVSIRGDIIDYNQAFLNLWDLTPNQMATATLEDLRIIVEKQVRSSAEYRLKTERWDQDFSVSIDDEITLKNGNVYLVHAKPQIVNGKAIGRVWSIYDATLQKRLEKELLHQATYDTLTGLPNKSLILDLLTRSLDRARHTKTNAAIFMLDLDKFSTINDLFGRSRGDLLLKVIADRLKSVLRENEIIGRIAGDEFVIIVSDVKNDSDIVNTIYRLRNTFDNPFNLYGHNISMTCTIGGTVFPKDAKDTDTVLSNIDMAVLKAKKEGRNGFKLYTEEMNVYTLKHIEMESELHAAVLNNEFVLHYQPIINLQTGRPYSVEALIRWQHPIRGIIQPLEFIPLAENLGLINKIGAWVLDTACKQLVAWQKAGCEDLMLSINVNVSAHQFKLGDIIHSVSECLKNSKLSANNLNLELTESVLLSGGEEMDSVLLTLNNMGVNISIDDFGIGYSSFAYLRKFKVNTLKIDKSFITYITTNKEDQAIVCAVLALGKSLQQNVLAEGVETEAQLEFLMEHGCNLAQGFLFAKPMPASECWEYLRQFIR